LARRHRAGVRQFFHLRHIAIERLELRIIVEDTAGDIVDEGLGKRTVGADDLMGLCFDVVDGNGISKLQINQPELGFPPSSVER
jgi:hypothetical protein